MRKFAILFEPPNEKNVSQVSQFTYQRALTLAAGEAQFQIKENLAVCRRLSWRSEIPGGGLVYPRGKRGNLKMQQSFAN